jgi:hypothetical protein
VPTATVSGTITRDVNNKGIGGVTVSLFRQPSGPMVTTSTNGQGNYSFAGVATGFTYTITPSHNRYTFTPTNRSIFVGGNVSGQNFVGSR